MCVDGEGGDACVRVFASGARFWKGQGRRCSGKGPGKECVRFLTRVGNVQGRGGICSQMCQRALTRKRTLLGGGTLEIGHGAHLERLAQLGDAHDGVGAVAIMVDAAEPVAGQTAKKGGVSTGADTKANALRAGGTHELLQYAILLNAARDDDGGRDAGKEFDLLGRLRALELVDLKRATIDTAKGEVCRVTQKRTLGGRFEVTAHFRLVI